MARKPCIEHRCPEYATPGSSRCAPHQRAWEANRWSRGGTGARGGSHQPGQAVRRKVLILQRHACAGCGCQIGMADGVEPFELHHKDGDATNNALWNLEALCKRCHKQAGDRLRAAIAALKGMRAIRGRNGQP